MSRLKLRITVAAEKSIRSGHPWLFAESVLERNRDGETGELAVIYDKRNDFLATGLFDSDSPIQVRILHTGKPQMIDHDWWVARVENAVAKRAALVDDKTTTGFRWINGESDGWPGLVLDRYGGTLVLKLYTAAWLPRLEEITGLLKQGIERWMKSGQPCPRESNRSNDADKAVRSPSQPSVGRIVLRLSRNIQTAAFEKWRRREGEILLGPSLDQPIVFSESDLRFEADVLHGQKTGFFLDQRENRRKVASLANSRAVLNAFSFTGGFSVYAARGGATAVTDLDISSHALAGGRRNFELNQSIPAITACRRTEIKADAFEWLKGHQRKQFDLIILDPPSLAKRESERVGAIKAYVRLASDAITHLRLGGTLVACSCSAHVSTDEFFDAVRGAAAKSDRTFRELETTGHAPDHPATFKEAAYLKAIYFQF